MLNINIILASASPRRQELLKMIIDNFEVRPADIDETVSDGTNPFEAAELIAVKKAQAVKDDNALIIACDTVVIIDGVIL